MATVQQIIGKINPELYAENGKELLKEYGSWDKIPADKVKPCALKTTWGDSLFMFNGRALNPVGGIEAKHRLMYDSSSETLEPMYFYILDFMGDTLGFQVEKLVDNFTSSPGSGHFAELGQRATIMQQQGTKILGDVNTVLRSVLNLIYDLKDFRTRLKTYDDLKSKDKGIAEAAKLTLKQIWIDRVDVQKGNTGIKAMAFGQGGFQTLLDAFLVVNDEKDVDKIDLNDRVRRILKPRIQEFNVWVEQSEKELNKRYALEKTYLKSQVNSLKLYSRWAKPYLRAASQLEAKDFGREPALVKTFNTILLELTLFAKSKFNPKSAILNGQLSKDMMDSLMNVKLKRDYFSCILVDFKFRGIPQKSAQHYLFGGYSDITFSAYALNSDEIDKINEELAKSDVEDVLTLIESATSESLKQLQEDINFFLEEKDKEKPEEKKPSDMSNPFLALFGFYENEESKTKSEEKKLLKPDNFVEKNYIRPLAAESAEERTFLLFDVYKKAHGMPSYG